MDIRSFNIHRAVCRSDAENSTRGVNNSKETETLYFISWISACEKYSYAGLDL